MLVSPVPESIGETGWHDRCRMKKDKDVSAGNPLTIFWQLPLTY
jgi:hypothetical protein